ncbi:hypothetical protein ACFYY3_07835 [Streptomyces sp. NPDC001812]|uniref:hypothetical protein n=1 Tax=unclassified Streptomyces TaxID=2593676 RepID=UPI00366940D7
MTLSPTHLRLLPWSDDGKPAFLSADGTATPLSLLADRIEEQQIATASAVLDLSKALLGSGTPATADEYHFVTRRLAECLTDVLHICESRGQRIPPYEDDDESDEETDEE